MNPESARITFYAEKRRQAEDAKARKLQDRTYGYSTNPRFRWSPKEEGFVELPVRLPPASQTTLEINGRPYSWPGLAGEASGWAIREAAGVWRGAKDFYGLTDEETRRFLRNKKIENGRALSFTQYARLGKLQGRSWETSAGDWLASGLKLPSTWRSLEATARDKGNAQRDAAHDTGLIRSRIVTRKEPQPKPTYTGGYTARMPWQSYTAEAAPISEPVLVRQRVEMAPPVYTARAPPPVVVPVFDIIPEKKKKIVPRSRERANVNYGPSFERETAHLPEEVQETLETRISSPKSYSSTPGGILYAVNTPPLSPSSRTPPQREIVRPDLSAKPKQRSASDRSWIYNFPGEFLSQTGLWRVRDGAKVPHLEIVKASPKGYDDRRKVVLVRQDEEDVLYRLFINGYTPKQPSDFIPLKSGGTNPAYSIETGQRMPTPLFHISLFIANLRPLDRGEIKAAAGKPGSSSYWKVRLFTDTELKALARHFGREPLDPDNWRKAISPRDIPNFPNAI